MSDEGRRPARRPRRRQRSQGQVWRERTALVFTGLVKLVGLAIAADEAFIKKHADPTAFALAAFMMAGAQGFDNYLSRGSKDK